MGPSVRPEENRGTQAPEIGLEVIGLHSFSFSFVFGVFVEADDVYHFAEATADAVAVAVFYFFGVEVGGYMRKVVVLFWRKITGRFFGIRNLSTALKVTLGK